MALSQIEAGLPAYIEVPDSDGTSIPLERRKQTITGIFQCIL
jgi:hypothetical protein